MNRFSRLILEVLIPISMIGLTSCGEDDVTAGPDDSLLSNDRVIIEGNVNPNDKVNENVTPTNPNEGTIPETNGNTTPNEPANPSVSSCDSEVHKFEESLYNLEKTVYEAIQRGNKEIDVKIEHIWLPTQFNKLKETFVSYQDYIPTGNYYKVNLTISPNEQLTLIPHDAFSNCSVLKSVTLPEGITAIDSSAFYKCENLENILIPESVKKIGYYAFDYCNSLKTFNVPNGIENIWFSNCYRLESITIPEGVKDIYISECPMLKNIDIPNGAKQIDISRCGLNTIEIPSNVNEVSISNCYSLSSISTSTNVDNVSISSCPYLNKLKLSDRTKSLQIYDIGIAKLELPNSISSLSIDRCYYLKNFNIPTNIDDFYMESSSPNLESITTHDNISRVFVRFSDIDTTSYAIPTGVTIIDFNNCDRLKNITIPNSVTELATYCFNGTSLTQVTIPSSVKKLGRYVFDCKTLTEITFEGPMPEKEQYYGLSIPSNAIIKVPSQYLDDYIKTLGTAYNIIGY